MSLRSFARFATCVTLAAGLLSSTLTAATNAFFAMDNIARGGPGVAPAMLRELGYDGFGGRALDEIMPPAIAAAGLKFFNGYHVITLDPAQPAPNEKLRQWFAAMRGRDTVLWLAVQKVARGNGTFFPPSSAEADRFVVGEVRAIAEAAAAAGLRVALYPHTGFWLEGVEDALRIADQVNRPDVGVTFNLCHWLKVEGDRDPRPVLKEALPRLFFVTLNGAEAGDTRKMDWNKLIQPLDAGTYDVAGLMKTLRDLGYAGPIGFQGYGIPGDSREILRCTMNGWLRINAP